MFKPQTKDKQLIDELRQKNSELEREIVRLRELVQGMLKKGNEGMV